MMVKDVLNRYYGYMFEEELIKEISLASVLKKVKKDDTLINVGSYIKSMPLLVSGTIKILREDKEQGELLLYFLERGEYLCNDFKLLYRNC